MGATIEVTLVCATLIIYLISMPNICEAAGFTVDLIHRNSLQSPSIHSSFEHVQTSLERSFSRARTLVPDNSVQSTSTDVVSDGGEYLMKFSLGTPPTETLAIADTGSDLTWIQCKPCLACFKQKSPIFDSKRSSTYKPAACNSETCETLERTSCNFTKKTCSYTMGYGDRSYSKGELATDTITLGSTKIPKLIIGCGHNNQGTFGAGASGIVGLGGGKVSLITQLRSEIKGKFSYCLVPFLGNRNPAPSKMNFGDNAVVSGAGVVSTPIVPKNPDTYYYLTLEGMTVGGVRLNLVNEDYSSWSEDRDDYGEGSTEGNIIIDSGTTLTFLPTDLYYKVQGEVKRQMKKRPIRDPAGILNLCYQASQDDVDVPQITAHFKGADLKLKAANTFVKTTQTSFCLAFAPATSVSIYGNLAQMGFLVGYNLEEKTVSFKPTDCTKA